MEINNINDLVKHYTPVTRPFMPALDEFLFYLNRIWETKILSNNGEFHKQLESALCDYLGIEYLSLFSNGTLALITALQSMRITGEVITTPFSFIATTHSLWWNNIKPVFVDIDQKSFNLDPEKIEAAITPFTTAIMPVHVYGNPCDVLKIKNIAEKYGLKVIYDAAHSFGVRKNGRSILAEGDLSILSFHATKVFSTFEGGAIVCHDAATKKRLDYLKNFGIANETEVVAPGINAKMNEIQAAFGILQLKYVSINIQRRKKIAERYKSELYGIPGLTFIEDISEVEHNYAYFPIFVGNDDSSVLRDLLHDKLKEVGVWSRKYFYPLISTFSTYRTLPSSHPDNLQVAHKVASKVLCLPIFPDLPAEEQDKIINVIHKVVRCE